MVLRHGNVVAQGWWAPYSADRRHLLYSLSKSFTSTAAAFAAAEGLLRLDDPVIAHFPELDAEVTDPRSRSMLVRHVASMASGHAEETWGEVIAADPVEPVRAFLKLPPDQEPGDHLRLQPVVHLHAGGHHPAGVRADADRIPAAPALRPAGHRCGGLAAAPGRSRPGLHRSARDHRRHRRAGPALPAARVVERRAIAVGGMGRRGDPVARRQRRREHRLAPGLRIPVLDVAARLPR